MTIAPPTPSRPATNAPTNPSASRVRANASVTGSAPNFVGPALTQARVVRREVVNARLDHVLRIRLHLGRWPPAPGVVLDRFLEVPGRDARDDRHRVGRALAARAVTRAAGERLGGAGPVERSGRGDAGHQNDAEAQ